MTTLYVDDRVGTASEFSISLTTLPGDVEPGTRILLDDGVLELVVLEAETDRVRCRITHNFYGDQGIFMTASVFRRTGGFADTGLLEDVRMCRRLRRMGRLRLARRTMYTSPRRFVRHGPLRQALLDLVLLTTERLGMRPARLYAWYNKVGSDEATKRLSD